MAVVTTYDQVGIKEDISNIISNIAPTDTPFLSSIGSENCSQPLFQWQEDTLAAPDGSNAAIQGAAAPTAVFTATVLRNNRTQILTKVASVSGTTDVTKAYGRDGEMAYQLAKKSKELKRDLETIMLSNQALVTGNSSTTASKMNAAQQMINSTHQFHAADATTTLNSGALSAFNETVLLKANQVLYTDGGEATILMIKPTDSQLVAAFASASGRQRYIDQNGGAKKIINVIDIYVSPYGEQKVVLNRFQPVTDAILFDPSSFKKVTLRPWFRETLAKLGDSTQIQLLGEFSLKHKNYKASALITDLS